MARSARATRCSTAAGLARTVTLIPKLDERDSRAHQIPRGASAGVCGRSWVIGSEHELWYYNLLSAIDVVRPIFALSPAKSEIELIERVRRIGGWGWGCWAVVAIPSVEVSDPRESAS